MFGLDESFGEARQQGRPDIGATPDLTNAPRFAPVGLKDPGEATFWPSSLTCS